MRRDIIIVFITAHPRFAVEAFQMKADYMVFKPFDRDDIQDVLQDTQDAVGEVTNMVSGQARAGLTEMGLTLQGSTPTVIVGTSHSIRHISAGPVIAIPFTSAAGNFTVEFCFE